MAPKRSRSRPTPPPQAPADTPQPTYDPNSGVPAPNVPAMLGVATDWSGEVRRSPENTRALKRITIGGEHGVPGIKHWFGRLYEEWLPALSDDKGRRTFVEMAWNEPAIFSFRYAIEMLVRQVSWEVEPFDDSPEEVEWAQFIDSCLHDLDRPWAATVAEKLTMLIYGFAVEEMVFKLRKGREPGADQNGNPFPKSNHDDGKVGFAKLAPRHQETIWRWELDPHGDLLGIVQWAPPTWRFTEIPIEVLLHYKTHEWHGSPEGVSVLRGAYVPYSFKKTIQTLEAIAIEREGCGMPVVRMPAERMRLANEDSDEGREASAEKTALEKLARDIKTDAQMGVVMPSEFDQDGHQLYDIQLLSAGGSRAIATNEVIQRYSGEILSAVIADFLAFGHETTGTQALGSNRTKLFLTSVNTLIDCCTGPMNRIGIPLLCELNGKKENFPVLGHSALEEADLGAIAPYITALANIGINLLDSQTERHLRRIADLPVPEVEGGR